MIVKCEECKSEFNLDGNKLKESGSKVKCSVCENIFTVFPQKPDEVSEEDIVQDEAFEETVALDSPPLYDEDSSEETEEEVEEAFEKAFDDSLADKEIDELAQEEASEPTVSLDHPPEGIEDEGESRIDSSEKQPRSSSILLIPLIILLVIIIGFLAVYFISPNLLPDSLSFLKPPNKEEITDTGVRRLTFKDVNGTFAQSSKAGQLFVINGNVVNDDSISRSYVLLKGLILDDKGVTVKRKLAYAGNTFTELELQDISSEMIEEGMKNREGKAGANVNVSPGSSIPFMIVFTDLPENLSEFVVEAVSAAKGE